MRLTLNDLTEMFWRIENLELAIASLEAEPILDADALESLILWRLELVQERRDMRLALVLDSLERRLAL